MATAFAPEPAEEISAGGGAMSDNELAALLSAHEAQAVGYYTSEIADEQAMSLDYYYGRPFGDERTGRSQVVDRTVAIVVDNAVAAILRPFASADDTVVFEPVGPEDEDIAEQATEYVSYVIYRDNAGFMLLHNWCKAGLLEKLGIVKVWWEEKEDSKVERLEGLDAMQLEMLLSDQSTQVVGGPYLDEDETTFALDVLRTEQDGRIKIITVPSEEFLIAAYSRDIETAEYVAHKPKNFTRSDALEMGFDPDVVDGLAASQSDIAQDNRSLSRLQDEDFASARGAIGIGNDKSRDLIDLIDEYVLVDYDGDGIAERRRIVRVGDEILLNEEVDCNPFAVWCPVPMPHKVYGLSLADQTRDLQRISSVLWRQTLDNLYLANNPKVEVPQAAATADGATYDDLQDPAPGGIVRSNAGGLINPLAIPFVADKSFPMLEYAERQQEARTGISREGQGMSRDALDKSGQITATQAAIEEDGRNARAEMIARVFAEMGVSRLYRLILKLLVKHQPRERLIRLRNQWVTIDPREWNAEMDVSISVGLGVGSKAAQQAQADGVLATLAELVQSPFGYLVGPEEAYHAVKRKLNAAGVKDTENYLKDPKEAEPPEPQPSPEMAKVEAQAQADQARLELDAQKSAAELEGKREEAALKLQLMREEAAAKIELEREKAAAEQALAMRQQDFEMEMAREQMVLQREQAAHQAKLDEDNAVSKKRPGGDLDK